MRFLNNLIKSGRSCSQLSLIRNGQRCTISSTYSSSSNVDDGLETIPAENHYDIVINGGGIIGFSLLAAIKSSRFLSSAKVLLIEQQKEPLKKNSENHDNLLRKSQIPMFSNRVSAITLGSKEFFQDIQVWSELESYSKKVQGMYVWADYFRNGIFFSPSTGSWLLPNVFGNNESTSVCYIMENNRIMEALYQRINDLSNPNQKVFYETVVTDIRQIPKSDDINSIALKIVNDKNDPGSTSNWIKTKLLIGCDGFKSIVRSKSTLPYFEYDLNQMGVVGTLEIESPYPMNQVAFQRFVSSKDTVIALLPLSEKYSSLVLSVPRFHLNYWNKMSDDEFVENLNSELINETKVMNVFDKFASTFTSSGGRGVIENKQAMFAPIVRSIVPGSKAAFPLGFGTTVPFLVGRIQSPIPFVQALTKRDNTVNTVIIGDAAHRIHPLAGQGLNLGLGDASILASSLETKLAAGYSLFDSNSIDSPESLSHALYEFERCRVLKLVPMMAAIHTMPMVHRLAPSSILSVFNSFDLAKKAIVQFANSR